MVTPVVIGVNRVPLNIADKVYQQATLTSSEWPICWIWNRKRAVYLFTAQPKQTADREDSSPKDILFRKTKEEKNVLTHDHITVVLSVVFHIKFSASHTRF